MPVSIEAIMAVLVVIRVIMVMLIERIQEPYKEVRSRRWGCDSPESKAKPPSGF
jgi:hypothetical protein